MLAAAPSVVVRNLLHALPELSNMRQSAHPVAVSPLFLSFPAKIVLFIAMSASRRNGHHAPAVMTRTVTATQAMAMVAAGIAAIMAATTKITGKIVFLSS